MAWVLEEIRATKETLRYGFAVGKVRVLESKTLDHSAYERLLDAPSFAEQRRILSETVYGRYLENVQTADEIELALDQALVDFQGLLEEAELPAPVVRFFRLRSDYANLKATIKARVLGVPLTGMLAARGEIAAERFAGDVSSLPEPFGSLATTLLAKAEAGRSLAEIDADVDRAQYEALHQAARDARSAFLGQLAALLSDTANTKILVRARAVGLPASRVREMLVAGGTASEATLMALYSASPVDMAAGLERIPSLFSAKTEGVGEPGLVDIITDNALMRLLRLSRRAGVGPEPVIAYVLAREAEVQSLRVLLVGRMAGLDADTLRRRLRDAYR